MDFFDAQYFGNSPTVYNYGEYRDLDADETLITFSDMMYRTMEREGMLSDDLTGQKKVERAIDAALRDLPTKHPWQYYNRVFYITTSPKVELEITYTESNRQASVTSGSLPSDASYGELHINSEIYPIQFQGDSTTLVIDSGQTPGADYTGSATWVRSTYKIPRHSKIHTVWQSTERRPLSYLPQPEMAEHELIYQVPGTTRYFSISGRSSVGAVDLKLQPAPSQARKIVINANWQPAFCQNKRVYTAMTGTEGGVTFTDPSANLNWVGSVVRAAEDGSSNPASDIIQGDYVWQSVIKDVTGTTVTVSNSLPHDMSAEVGIVSNYIDIDYEVMQTYFEDLAFVHYCRNYSHEGLNTAMSLASQSLRNAKIADKKINRTDPLLTDFTRSRITDIRWAEVQ